MREISSEQGATKEKRTTRRIQATRETTNFGVKQDGRRTSHRHKRKPQIFAETDSSDNSSALDLDISRKKRNKAKKGMGATKTTTRRPPPLPPPKPDNVASSDGSSDDTEDESTGVQKNTEEVEAVLDPLESIRVKYHEDYANDSMVLCAATLRDLRSIAAPISLRLFPFQVSANSKSPKFCVKLFCPDNLYGLDPQLRTNSRIQEIVDVIKQEMDNAGYQISTRLCNNQPVNWQYFWLIFKD